MIKRILTMIDLIKNEFRLANYKIVYEKNNLTLLKHNEFNDFWCIFSGDFDLENQVNLYKELSCFREQYKYADKNTSVLILDMVELYPEDENYELTIENDAYYFKKYVLMYTQNDVEELKKQLDDDQNQGVKKALMSIESFQGLKLEGKYGKFNLLYSIAQKLPFVTLGVRPTEYIIDREFSFDDDDIDTVYKECDNLVSDFTDIDDSVSTAITNYINSKI